MSRTVGASIPSAGRVGLSPLTLREALDLISGTATVIEMISAMLCQPRYRGGMDLNAAGRELRDLVTGLELRHEDLLDLIESLPASSEFEQTRRLATLLRFRGAEAMTRSELSALTAGLTGPIN